MYISTTMMSTNFICI